MSTDLDFAVKRVDSFHVRTGGGSYWEGYVDAGERASDRFLVTEGWRTVYARRVESAIIRVELADGHVGWGEANAPILPEIVCLIARDLLGPMLSRRSFDHPSAMWSFLYDLQRGRGHQSGYQLDAIAAVDIAVWDALARRADMPLAALLDDAPRRDIPVYLSGLRQATRAERAAHARRLAAEGLQGVKLFLDGNLEAALDELSSLQQSVPDIQRWMVDLLWSLESVDKAVAAKHAFGELGAEWLECPLLPEDLAGHRQLHGTPGSPIALGESFHTEFELAPWLDPRSLDVFQPDMGRTGISNAMRQCSMASAAGVAVTPHMGSGFDVFQAATLQFAAICDDGLLCEFQAGLNGRLDDAIDNGWHYEGGMMRLPDRAGIGIEVDAEKLARFVVEH